MKVLTGIQPFGDLQEPQIAIGTPTPTVPGKLIHARVQ
jgi:hypothetical protein